MVVLTTGRNSGLRRERGCNTYATPRAYSVKAIYAIKIIRSLV
jgi:hypothetical protein